MRTCTILLGAIAVLAVASSPARANNTANDASNAAVRSPASLTATPAPRKPAQTSPPGKVWSNPDLDALRAQGLLSLVGPYPAEAPLPPAPVGSQAAPLAPASETTPQNVSAPYDRYRDPLWYADQASQLETELALTDAGLRTAAGRLNEAQDRDTQPGINLDRGNVGVTPQEGVAILQQRARDVRDQLDDLNDLARHNDIPPGDLR